MLRRVWFDDRFGPNGEPRRRSYQIIIIVFRRLILYGKRKGRIVGEREKLEGGRDS